MTTLYVILTGICLVVTILVAWYWAGRTKDYIQINAEKRDKHSTRQYNLYVQIRDSLGDKNDWVENDQNHRCYFNFVTGIELKIQEIQDEVIIVMPTTYKFNKVFSRDLKRRFNKISKYVIGYTDKRREDLLKQYLAGNLEHKLKIKQIYEIHYNKTIREWVNGLCEGEVFYNGEETIYFTDQGDAVAFKLKWPELVIE